MIPVVRYDDGLRADGVRGPLAFRVDRAAGSPRSRSSRTRGSRHGDVGYARSVVVGGRLLLLSAAGVLYDVRRPPPGRAPRFGRLTASIAARPRCSPMPRFARLSLALATTCAALAFAAAPSMAIVGGSNAAAGEFPSVAEVIFGKGFLCTGTLIAPDYVLTAGHCGSITGGAGVATPAAWPAAAFDVYIGSNKPGQGEQVPVSQATVEPELPAQRRLRHHAAASCRATRPRRRRTSPARAEESLWAPSTLETIVGFGTTSRGRRHARHAAEGPGPDHHRRQLRAAPTAASTPRRCSAPATRRAASTPARATRAARCSAATPPAR